VSDQSTVSPFQNIWLLALSALIGIGYTTYVSWDVAVAARSAAYATFTQDAQAIIYDVEHELDRFRERVLDTRNLLTAVGGAEQKVMDHIVNSDPGLRSNYALVGAAWLTDSDTVGDIRVAAGTNLKRDLQVKGKAFASVFPKLTLVADSSAGVLDVLDDSVEPTLGFSPALIYYEWLSLPEFDDYLVFLVRDPASLLGGSFAGLPVVIDRRVTIQPLGQDGMAEGMPIVMADGGLQDVGPEQRLSVTKDVLVYGRKWRIEVSADSADYPADYARVFSALLTALLLTGVLIYFMWALTDRNRRVTQMVNRRTSALKQLNAELADNYRLLQEMNIELDDARRVAESANAAKSGFLATVSHELRTPLNAILGFSDMLSKQTLGPIEDQRYVEYAIDINKSGVHLLQLINDILDLAKLEAGKTLIDSASVNVEVLLDNVAALLGPEAEQKGLQLLFETADDMPASIVGDGLRLRQVLINLVGNALKFTEAGSVTIGMQLTQFPSGDDAFEISVTDTGVGIPADKVSRLFERFTQADDRRNRAQGGVGLGLSICRELVSLMNGQIACESEVGVGTTFRVTLPLIPVEVPSEHDDNVI